MKWISRKTRDVGKCALQSNLFLVRESDVERSGHERPSVCLKGNSCEGRKTNREAMFWKGISVGPADALRT
jgi:hypothetical protein